MTVGRCVIIHLALMNALAILGTTLGVMVSPVKVSKAACKSHDVT